MREIYKPLTKEEAVRKHRKLWHEVARMIQTGTIYKFGRRYKIEALHNLGEKRDMLCSCYCCEYSAQYNNGDDDNCIHCPIQWTEGELNQKCWQYEKFVYCLYEENYEAAYEQAKIIAELPEREGV